MAHAEQVGPNTSPFGERPRTTTRSDACVVNVVSDALDNSDGTKHIAQGAPVLSVLVVNYNTAALIRPMMDSLLASAAAVGPIQTIVLDNASRDDSLSELRTWSGDMELIVNPTNVGFGRANNQCLALARSPYVLLLNTDAFVAVDTLRKTMAYMESHPRCGVLGVRLVGRDGVLQPSCRYFPTVWNVFLGNTGLERIFPQVRAIDDMAWDHASSRQCDWVPGCYYLTRREVLDAVGLFDPRYFLYYEEVDHCRAVKAAGWTVDYFHDTTVVHIGGESAKSDSSLTDGGRQISALQLESELIYFRKHAGRRGLALHLVLTAVAGAVLSTKSLLKGSGWGAIRAEWRQVREVWSLASRTRWGCVPTR